MKRRLRLISILVSGLVVLGLAGCGQSGEQGSSAVAATDASPAAARIEKCVERFLLRVAPESGARTSEHELRRYVEATYCERFEATAGSTTTAL